MSYCLNPNCQKPQNPDSTKFCLRCGSKLLLGDRYRTLKPIGQGGFGRTFLAVDEYKPSQPRCVIKQFFPLVSGNSNTLKAAELFQREAVRLDELGKHPQIPELLAHFEQDGRQYLVQEFIDGQNLARELADSGAFNETQILQLLLDLLPVLQFIHSKQVIHRDIKPENIIRRRVGGQLVLVDFGASKFAPATELGRMGTAIGSAGYLAPEQVVGRAVAASDLYCLGVTCVHLLTAIAPFDLFDASVGGWVWRRYLKHPLTSELGRILDNLLQADLNQRYQSATEVMQALATLNIPANVATKVSRPQAASKTAAPANQASNFQAAPGKQSRISRFLGGTTLAIKGKIGHWLGNYEEAIASYDKAIQLEPDNYEAWYKKGSLCWELQWYDEAIICYQKTVDIRPAHFEAWRSLGALLYGVKRYEESATSYGKALHIQPKNAVVWLCRSMALKQSGKTSEAQMSFEKARQLLPKNGADKAAIMLEAWEILIRY